MFFLIISPFSLYYLFITPSDYGIIKPEDTGDWLGFYGAVLGGFLTLLGVWLTISYQKEQDNLQRAIEFKPILELTDVEVPQEIIASREVSLGIPVTYPIGEEEPAYASYRENMFSFVLLFTNNGRGETSNAKIESFVVDYEYNDWLEQNNLYSATSTPQLIGEILAGQRIAIKIAVPPYLLIKKEAYNERDTVDFDTVLSLVYNDMFDEKSYQYTLYIRFSAKMLKQEFEEEVNNSLHVVKVDCKISQILQDRKALE